MSTAQTPLPGAAAQEAADELSKVADPPTTTPPARGSTDVEYILFEEARQDTWTEITTVRAKSPEAAIETLGEQKLKAANGRFMAVASRYATKKKPNVKTVTTIDWD